MGPSRREAGRTRACVGREARHAREHGFWEQRGRACEVRAPIAGKLGMLGNMSPVACWRRLALLAERLGLLENKGPGKREPRHAREHVPQKQQGWAR